MKLLYTHQISGKKFLNFVFSHLLIHLCFCEALSFFESLWGNDFTAKQLILVDFYNQYIHLLIINWLTLKRKIILSDHIKSNTTFNRHPHIKLKLKFSAKVFLWLITSKSNYNFYFSIPRNLFNRTCPWTTKICQTLWNRSNQRR